MKKFQDRSVTIAGQPLSYSELLTSCINNHPQGGFAVEEMQARLRVLDAVSKAKEGIIELEDADYKKALACINAMRWGVLDSAIIQFKSDFEAADS